MSLMFLILWTVPGRWDARRNRPVPDAVWLEQHRRALPFVLKRENERAPTPRLIKLGEGVEIREDLLRGRWSRAGQESRPTKPPLDRRRVHALITYVSRHFPDVEVSRIKQVLAYKCKENCAALRMRTARLSNCFSESSNYLLSAAGRPPCDDPPHHPPTPTPRPSYSNYEASKGGGAGGTSGAGGSGTPGGGEGRGQGDDDTH
ncbi:unnamed protein product [Pieris macdunnoughi]|uniref:BEN domain-containing protein n=1 Tax=Pieris macdunnoughi TaxID=345717 RepID=A0A821X360_9NEOP|nr:unnamed protein product [Pieris macdunnoughi]